MNALYAELDAFENITSSKEDYPSWINLLNNGVEVFVNVDKKTLDKNLEDPYSLIALGLQAYGGMKEPKPYEIEFQKINQDITKTLDDPYGLYILNYSEEECKKAQEELGLSIFPSTKIPNNFYKLSIDEDFEKDEFVQCDKGILKGWQKVLEPFESNSSNSSIIVDRNLFANEERGKNVGINNLLHFLELTLPNKLTQVYDLTIITDLSNKVTRKNYREKLVNTIVDELAKLRPYSIDLELLFIHGSRPTYSGTHQRRVLKNYHYAFSEHGFSIFYISNLSKVRNDNTYKMFHSLEKLIENDEPNLSGIKLIKKLKKRLYEIKTDAELKLNELGQNDHHYRLFLNKNEVTTIKNRLLN
jgi:hypothetical protein